MKLSTKTRKLAVHIALAAILPALAACGDDSGGEVSPPADPGGQSLGEAVLCGAVYLFSNGTSSCGSSSGSTTSGGSLYDSGAPAVPAEPNDQDSWLKIRISEIEPNNTLAMAQPASIPTPTAPHEYGGILITGAINDQVDLTDVYITTPSRSGDHGIFLCPDTLAGCGGYGRLDVYAAFFRVMDQDGTVLLTTQADELGKNSVQMHLDAGVVYYIEVNAGDTTGIDLPYKLYASETAR